MGEGSASTRDRWWCVGAVPGVTLGWSLLAVMCLSAGSADAQPPGINALPARTEPVVRVTVDLEARAFDRALPFDVPFVVVGTVPEGTVGLSVQYTELQESTGQPSPAWRPLVPAAWRAEAATSAVRPFVVFLQDALEAKRSYRFRFSIVRQPSPDQVRRFHDEARSLLARRGRSDDRQPSLGTADGLQRDLAALARSVAGPATWEPAHAGVFADAPASRQAFLRLLEEAGPPGAPQFPAELSERLALAFRTERFGDADIVADGATTRNRYVSADAGLLYAIDLETAALYIGTNIYFRPVNKRAPLSQRGSVSRRLALTVGFTVTSIGDENERTRADMFGRQSLVLGLGLRVTQSVRLGAGALVFKEKHPNPLITTTSAATTPYVSFSFDLDVAGLFQRLGW
jgi:hypothetical protein